MPQSPNRCSVCGWPMARVSHGDEKAYECFHCLREAASPERRQAEWGKWLIAQLEPFHGQPWFNDVVNRLYGKPVAKPAKKKAVA